MFNAKRTPINELKYIAGIVSQSSWFVEFKKMTILVANGATEEELKKECLENNLLGAIKEYRAKRMYGYLLNRIKNLDPELVNLFINSDIATQKLINLICILRGDRLFFDFVYEVYREKAILGQKILEDSDVRAFFANKGNQSDFVAGLQDCTKKRLKGIYTNFLTDANLLFVENKIRKITTPIISDKLAHYLEKCGETSLFKAISGVA